MHGFDPYDYEYQIGDFIGEEVDPSEGEASDWIEQATPEQIEAFKEWTTRNPSDEGYYAPIYEALEYRGMETKPKWQIHFTENPVDIADSGFEYGHPEVEGVHLTTHKRDRNKKPGFNFSFDADGFRYNQSDYGEYAVLFPTTTMETYHYGDNQYQNIFWGPSVDPKMIFPIHFEGGEWTVKDWEEREVHSSEDLNEIINWIQTNWRQLASTREKTEAAGRRYRKSY